MCWSTETVAFKYKDCIERSFFREKDWLRFCKAFKISGVVGLAVCLLRRIIYDGDHRVEPCIFFRKSYLGKSRFVEKVLPEISKGTKYMPLPCKFTL